MDAGEDPNTSPMTPRGRLITFLLKGMQEHPDFTPVGVIGLLNVPTESVPVVAVMMPPSLIEQYRQAPATAHYLVEQVSLRLAAALLTCEAPQV